MSTTTWTISHTDGAYLPEHLRSVEDDGPEGTAVEHALRDAHEYLSGGVYADPTATVQWDGDGEAMSMGRLVARAVRPEAAKS